MKINIYEGKRSYELPTILLENELSTLYLKVLDNLDICLIIKGDHFQVDKSNSLVFDIFLRLYKDTLEDNIPLNDLIYLNEDTLLVKSIIIKKNTVLHKYFRDLYKRLLKVDINRMDITIDEYMYELKRVRK